MRVATDVDRTGVGEVKNGDGVHGLRRALALAGAETQVMSLWAVSDQATRELMISYYRMLQQGQGRGEALRRVQLEILKNSEVAASVLLGEFHPIWRVGKPGKQALTYLL